MSMAIQRWLGCNNSPGKSGAGRIVPSGPAFVAMLTGAGRSPPRHSLVVAGVGPAVQDPRSGCRRSGGN